MIPWPLKEAQAQDAAQRCTGRGSHHCSGRQAACGMRWLLRRGCCARPAAGRPPQTSHGCPQAVLPAPVCACWQQHTELLSRAFPRPTCRRARLARRLRRRSLWWSSTASTTSRSWWRAARRSAWVSAAARCRPRLCCVRVSFVRWGERRETAGTAARRSGRARQAQHALFAPQRSAVGMAWLGLQHSVAGAIQQAGTGAGVPC